MWQTLPWNLCIVFQMKGTLSLAAHYFMNAACCLSHTEQDTCRCRSRVIAFHRQCIYSIISLTFLFTPKEMFMQPIKQAFISSPTAWIDSEVVCLWLDYAWRSSYSICFALLCLRVVNLLSLSFLPSTSLLLCILRTALLGLWLKWRGKKLIGRKLNGMSVSYLISEIKVTDFTFQKILALLQCRWSMS